MKKVLLNTLWWTIVLGLIIAGSGNFAAPPGGPPGAPAAAPGVGGWPGAGLPDPRRKMVEFGYNGVIVKIDENLDFIEIRNSPIRPNEDWGFRPPMKIDIGPDTLVIYRGQELSLEDLKVGQWVQVTGIFAEKGLGLPTDYLTTDYQGTGPKGEIRRGKIEILGDKGWILKKHKEWIKKEEIRRKKYGLDDLKK